MLKKLYEFMADTSGATGIEYGFIVGGISVVLSTGALLMGDQISGVFEGLDVFLGDSAGIK